MQFPKNFFEDEVREGFFIPSIMKRRWAAELEVLEELDRICQKYDLKWFAAYGTLLGAARHGGFVPWDDDVDIALPRADYDRLMEVLPKELGEWYSLSSYHDLSQPFPHNAVCFNTGSLLRKDAAYVQKFHGCPYSAGVDIFPYDYVADEEEADEEHNRKHRTVRAVAIAYLHMEPAEQQESLRVLEKEFHVTFDHSKPIINQLWLLADRMAASQQQGTYVTVVASRSRRPNWKDYKVPAAAIEEVTYLPFEHIRIPVPKDWERVVSVTYTNWQVPRRAACGHSYPIYDYQDALWAKAGLEPVFHWFSYDPKRLPVKGERPYVVKHLVTNLLSMLKETGDGLPGLLLEAPAEAVYLLEDLQDAVISIGGNVEGLYGEDHPTIKTLEAYCEALYQLHEGILDAMEAAAQGGGPASDMVDALGGLLSPLTTALDHVEKSATEHILSRKEIIFLPIRYDWWDSLAPIYQAAKADPSCDVFVMPLIYNEIELDGSFSKAGPVDPTRDFPPGIVTGRYRDFAWEAHSCDVIYIQDPMDGDSLTYSVDPAFYSAKLATKTEHLVYVPRLVMQVHGPEDLRAHGAMRRLTNTPGVAHADHVVLPDEQLKQLYQANLTAWAGEDTASIWEEKLMVATPSDTHKKIIEVL